MSNNSYSFIATRLFVVLFVTVVITFFITKNVTANCSCSYPQYQQNYIGPEYMAESFVGDPCPPSNEDTIDYDSIPYKYKNQNNTDCSSITDGSIRLYSLPLVTYHDNTPAQIEQKRVTFYPNYWLLRNKSGTHFLFVDPDYSGSILGINLSSMPKGVYVVDDFNEYCSDSVTFTEPDADNDSFADCIDCLPNDDTNQGTCTSVKKNLGKCIK